MRCHEKDPRSDVLLSTRLLHAVCKGNVNTCARSQSRSEVSEEDVCVIPQYCMQRAVHFVYLACSDMQEMVRHRVLGIRLQWQLSSSSQVNSTSASWPSFLVRRQLRQELSREQEDCHVEELRPAFGWYSCAIAQKYPFLHKR
jgi:hypothetical protein